MIPFTLGVGKVTETTRADFTSKVDAGRAEKNGARRQILKTLRLMSRRL